jgi:hypothetical protein
MSQITLAAIRCVQIRSMMVINFVVSNEGTLKALIQEAVGLNKSKANEPSFYESHHL